MNLRNLLTIILAFVALTASSVVATTPTEAAHGGDHYVNARITARLGTDGRVEFALQQQLGGGVWGEHIFPRARYFPTTATVGQWLVSSTLTLQALDDPSSETDVRITARLGADGRVEFALRDRNDDGVWSTRIFPRARYFPTTATVGQWLVSSTLAAALPRSSADSDRAVLEAFYRATAGDNWWNHANWLTDRPLGEWHGVNTDSDGRVITLDIHANSLTGSIPPEIGNLTALKWLRLDWNDLSGSIPPELGNLTRLEWLTLSANDLTGSIPPELGSLTNLWVLGLSDNSLTGSIPPELGNLPRLEELSLSANDLTGPIPPELGSLTALKWLSLPGNNLSGSIPPEIGNLTRLERLSLRDNHLSGSIPPELGNLAALTSLWLHANSLTGSIPPELGNLTRLERLSLRDNHLSGSIPPGLGNLTALTSLWLNANSLSDSIPPELGNLPNLKRLHLANNDLSGAIPTEVAAMMTRLTELTLGGNRFTGTVPADRTPPPETAPQ